MSDNVNENEKVSGWWAASSDADHEQVSLYEVVRGGESFLDQITVTKADYPTLEEFIIEVKRLFGGGVYVAAVRGTGGTFVKRPRFAVSGRPIREKLADEPVAGSVPAQQQSDVALLLARMDENQRRSDERFAQLLESMGKQPAAESVDPIAMFERVAGIMSKSGAAPVPQKTLAEQLGELQTVQEFFEKMGGGGGGDGASGWAALQQLGAGLTDLLKENALTERVKVAARVKAGQQKPALPAAPGAPVEQQQLQAGSGMTGMLDVLAQLVAAASSGVDVKLIAPQLIQAAPNVATLKTLLESEDAIVKLEMMNPAVGQHFDWFADLAAETLELIEGAERGIAAGDATAKHGQAAAGTENPAGGRGKGNSADARPDGGTRAPRKAGATRARAGAKAGQ